MNTKSIKANLVTPVPTKTLPPAPAKKPKLTPWFDGRVKPARKGVYQRQYSRDIAYARWDGEQWMAGRFALPLAKSTDMTSLLQSLPWRGLASNPASNKGERA